MWLVIVTIVVAGILAGGMAALYWFAERPAANRYYIDARSVYLVYMGEPRPGRELEAICNERDLQA